MIKQKDKSTSSFRLMLTVGIIFLFLLISGILFYQYRQYQEIENRLTHHYNNSEMLSSSVNKLFTIFSEADNNFRLYTVDYEPEAFAAYAAKLDTIQAFVDSLATLPLEGNPILDNVLDMEFRKQLAYEFASLKKNMDYLVLHTKDSLSELNNNILPVRRLEMIGADSIVNKILSDTTLNSIQDTVVRKRQGLIRRIFNSKDDTLIVDVAKEQFFNSDHISVIHRNMEEAIKETNIKYNSNVSRMRNTFFRLQQKEKQLITTNFALLQELKSAMVKIRELEVSRQRQLEKQDFEIYRKNTHMFDRQLLFIIPLMVLMILILIYYQNHATKYERKLQEEKAYAAQLAEEKTSILAGVSHEIRTPLNSLLGMFNILKQGTESRPSELLDQKLIDSSYYSIVIISNTINDILNLSRLESDKTDISLTYFSPHKMFADLLNLHKHQADLRGLALKADINIDPKTQILSSEFRVKQITSNFIGNAIKYTFKGQIVFRAKIMKENGKDVLRIEVQDTGIGIPEKSKKQIFKKYYTAGSPAISGGFGLGLYISKILSDELHGQIGFTSKVNEGSTFYAQIPITRIRQVDQEEKPMKLTDLPENLRCLIVDDNPINILYMKQFFKNFRNVYTINNGVDALNMLEQNSMDFVITDINMPLMSGWELLNKIKSSPKHKHIKVFAVSAETSTIADENALLDPAKAFDGIVSKPFTEAELVKTIMITYNLKDETSVS